MDLTLLLLSVLKLLRDLLLFLLLFLLLRNRFKLPPPTRLLWPPLHVTLPVCLSKKIQRSPKPSVHMSLAGSRSFSTRISLATLPASILLGSGRTNTSRESSAHFTH